VTGAGAPARSCAVWPLAGSYFAVGHEVGLPDRREPWRVPASVGQLEGIHLPTFPFPLALRQLSHLCTLNVGEVGITVGHFCARCLGGP
jgi:hypothetical protein